MILLIASLAFFLISMYCLAESMTSDGTYDICWYGAKSLLAIIVCLYCLKYAG